MLKIKIRLIIILLSGIWLAGCDQLSEIDPSGKVVRIAYISSDIGDAPDDSDDQDDILAGVLAANAADPFLDNGDKLEIVYARQVESEMEIPDLIKDYIKQDNISAILLGSNSKSILQIKHDIDAFELPTLAVVATHPDVVDGVEFISQLSFDDERQGQAAALFVRDELLLKRAAVFFDDADPHSGYLGQIFRTMFEQTGGVIDGFYLVSELNQATLEKLKAKNTQIIYMPFSAKKVLTAVTLLETLDWQPELMGADSLFARVIQEYPDRLDELDGMYVIDLYTDKNDFVNVSKFVKRILGFYDEMYRDESNSDTALGVEGYQVLKVAINQCLDRNNGNCINQKVRSIENQQGIISNFSILSNGKSRRPIFINTIKNNRLNMIVKVN
jgi:ABC-type branched-subunit amino acid transport system substrate-binding protein